MTEVIQIRSLLIDELSREMISGVFSNRKKYIANRVCRSAAFNFIKNVTDEKQWKKLRYTIEKAYVNDVGIKTVLEARYGVPFIVEKVDNRSFSVRSVPNNQTSGTGSDPVSTENGVENVAMKCVEGKESAKSNTDEPRLSDAGEDNSTAANENADTHTVESSSTAQTNLLMSIATGKASFPSYDSEDASLLLPPQHVMPLHYCEVTIPRNAEIEDYMIRLFNYQFALEPQKPEQGPSTDILKWSEVFQGFLEMGVPLEAADHILEEVRVATGCDNPAPKLEAVGKELTSLSHTPHDNQRIFICRRCHRGIPFLNVFCPYCLEEKELVWLVEGCDDSECYANLNVFGTIVFDEQQIETYKNAVCTHSHRTAAYREILYNSMIRIVSNLMKAGLLSRLSNTTYDEMVITAKICKEEKVMSSLLETNSLSVLKWLDVPVVPYLESCAKVIRADDRKDTSFLDKGLTLCAGEGSTERELFVFQKRNRLINGALKLLEQRFYDNMTIDMKESEEETEEVHIQAMTREIPLSVDAPEVQLTSPPKKRKIGTNATSPNPWRQALVFTKKPSVGKERLHSYPSSQLSNTRPVERLNYTREDVKLLLSFSDKSRENGISSDGMEEKSNELRREALLKSLSCKKGDELLAATVISLWLQWKAISKETRSVDLYQQLLDEYLKELPKEDRPRAASIALTNEFQEQEESEAPTEEEKVPCPTSQSIQWKRPNVDKPIQEHVLLISLYVNSIESYAVSNTSSSLFIVNAVINNALTSERNTKRMSHCLAIIPKEEDVVPVMKCILKDLTLTGKNGIYVSMNTEWYHIRWGVTGIHDDTVTQEDTAGMGNKECLSLPCMFHPSCESEVLSPLEGICVPQRIRVPAASNEMKMQPRTVDLFPADSPYRYLKSCYYHVFPSQRGWPSARKRALSSLQGFFSLFKKKLPCWIPPAIPMDSLLSLRQENLRRLLKSNNSHILSHEDNGQADLTEQFMLDSVNKAFASNKMSNHCTYDIGLDEYLKVPPEGRFSLDPMCHIVSVGSRILDAMNHEYSVQDKAFEQYLQRSIGITTTLKDMIIPPEVVYQAAERIFQLRKPWKTKKVPGTYSDGDAEAFMNKTFRDHFKAPPFSTTHQTAPPSWLKPQIVTKAGYNKKRNHEMIIFLLCYFGWVFQDSMYVPFVFASKQVFDCLGYLYNHVNDLQKAKNVQMVLDFFLEFMRSIMPPSFATASLCNSSRYYDTLVRFGPFGYYDSSENERYHRYSEFDVAASPNPEVALQERMMQLEKVSVLSKGFAPTSPSLLTTSSGTPYHNKDLVTITKWNLTDDKAFFLDDSVPFPTYVDSQLGTGTRIYVDANEFKIDAESAMLHSEVIFRGEKCHSATLPRRLSTKWLVENSDSIGFLKTINGEIAMFVVTGYIVVKVNGELYPQAICKYLETRSTSSFLSTQHERICYKSYDCGKMKEVVVSLYQLHMNEAVSLYYKNADICGYALNSISIRQSNPIKEDRIFNRKSVSRYDKE